MKTETNLKSANQLDYISLALLATYPLALIFGNFIINLYIFLFSVSFLINFKENKIIFKDKIFYLLVFFFISLLINNFFSLNPGNSFPRVFKILLVIFFIFEIKRLIYKYEANFIKKIYKLWFWIFLILTIDILFETLFGHNMVGNKSNMLGRIASFFGNELIIGAFYHGFAMFIFSYLILNKTKSYFLVFLIFFILLMGFLIGERSNYIKLFLSTIFFFSLALQINYKVKIISFFTMLIIMFAIINLHSPFKSKYYNQIKDLFAINGYSEYIKNSHYGAHRDAAIKIFKQNLIFGVGVKNFRNESGKKIYENKDYAWTNSRQSTHPHQIHHEFLSETGIFGYLCFLIFIISAIYLSFKNYLKYKNLYQLSAIIFIITSLLPLLPSGSFLSTYVSGIFWINFAIMSAYIKN